MVGAVECFGITRSIGVSRGKSMLVLRKVVLCQRVGCRISPAPGCLPVSIRIYRCTVI